MINIETFLIAGGKGTRFKSVSKKPKILIKLGERSLLQTIIRNLKKYKIKKINIFVGQNFKEINKFVLKNKININIIKENKLLGTAGCLSLISKKKLKKNILIIFGDIFFEVDFTKMINFHNKNKSDVTILSHPSDHMFDSDIIDVDSKNSVRKFYFKPHKRKIISHNLTMAGIFLIDKKLLSLIPKYKKQDFSKNFLSVVLKKKYKVFSYKTREYCKDLGTSLRFKKVRKDFNTKKHKSLSLRKKIRAIFVDRDGVINIDEGPQKYSNPLNFIENSIDGLSRLRKLDYLIILITNQSAVAKGFLTIDALENSFKKLETRLSKNGFYFDDIYYCPHYPKNGYKGENKKYKIKCSCRKPKPGMILSAARKFNIDLKNSFFIGDSLRDYQAAKAAKVNPIILSKLDKSIKDYKYFKNLNAASKYIKNL